LVGGVHTKEVGEGAKSFNVEAICRSLGKPPAERRVCSKGGFKLSFEKTLRDSACIIPERKES